MYSTIINMKQKTLCQHASETVFLVRSLHFVFAYMMTEKHLETMPLFILSGKMIWYSPFSQKLGLSLL
ncbi:hypothetical protein CAI16_18855 [Virgibacillus dokdonensis]|uniref:Uncharacterized protein n=1 Tax=Virgibacillus dokdonensis TaxID=302167 RepID=A0A3E0WJA5_9BACI|nr:hypothetical protein CAI16_18855 [Virgibacillus dokdonensis]